MLKKNNQSRKLKAEAIEALANAKAEDARRAAEEEESENQEFLNINRITKGSDMPIPPPMMEPPPVCL